MLMPRPVLQHRMEGEILGILTARKEVPARLGGHMPALHHFRAREDVGIC